MLKLIISVVIALVIGFGSGMYYTNHTHQAVTKMKLKSQIMTQAGHLNMLDEGSTSELRDLLVFMLDCDVQLLNDNIEKGLWQKSLTDTKALQEAEPFYDPENHCSKDVPKTSS